jgi:hypothetical protein
MTKRNYIWREVSRWMGNLDWRFWTVGLSSDGKFCFGFWWDNSAPMLYSVAENRIIWNAAEDEKFLTDASIFEKEDLDLNDWLKEHNEEPLPPYVDWLEWLNIHKSENLLTLEHPNIRGVYHLLGLEARHPKMFEPSLNLKLSIDTVNTQIILNSLDRNDEIQRLTYPSWSPDWAFASFSEDGSTIAVIEPIYVSFFREFESTSGDGDLGVGSADSPSRLSQIPPLRYS